LKERIDKLILDQTRTADLATIANLKVEQKLAELDLDDAKARIVSGNENYTEMITQ
jgi:hypothetical protein